MCDGENVDAPLLHRAGQPLAPEIHKPALYQRSVRTTCRQPPCLKGPQVVAEIGVRVWIRVAELVPVVRVVKHEHKCHDVLAARHLPSVTAANTHAPQPDLVVKHVLQRDVLPVPARRGAPQRHHAVPIQAADVSQSYPFSQQQHLLALLKFMMLNTTRWLRLVSVTAK